MSETLQYIIMAVIVVGSIVLSFVFNYQKDYFFYEGGGWITGFLLGAAISTLIALFVQPARRFLESEITSLFKIFELKYPEFGTVWFWVVLSICIITIICIWRYWDYYGNNVLKIFWMLLFGSTYFVGTLMIVIIAVRLLLIAIALVAACVFGLCFIGGGGSSEDSSVGDKKEPEEKKKVEVYTRNGYFVQHYKVNSDQTHYYDPEKCEWIRIDK